MISVLTREGNWVKRPPNHLAHFSVEEVLNQIRGKVAYSLQSNNTYTLQDKYKKIQINEIIYDDFTTQSFEDAILAELVWCKLKYRA